MVIAASKAIGVGLYTPFEAARYVRARPEAIVRWLYGNERGERVVQPRFEDADKTITFIDMIQLLAIRAVRTQTNPKKIPLQRIRDAVTTAVQEYGVEHPLAVKHRLFAFGDSVVIKVTAQGNQLFNQPSEFVVGVAGPDKRQHLFEPIVEPFLDEISFTGIEGLADRWTPMRADAFEVRLDPKQRFGQPYIHPTMILVDALAAAVKSEGSIEAAAEQFETEPPAVKLALKYQDSLTGLAA